MAYHFHWPYDQIMNLDHFERTRWVHEIAKIINRLNSDGQSEDAESEFTLYR